MRRKHLDILKRRIQSGDVTWLARQGWKFLSVPLSFYLRRTVNRPVFGGLVVTYRCNEACPMCEVHKKADKSREISTAAFLDLADQMAELGVSGVSITGGEPLLREDVLAIIERLKARRIPVSLSTNGLRLRDADLARALLRTGIDAVAVSVDGATAEEHDASRGVPGAFERTLDGLRTLLAVRDEIPEAKRAHITLASVLNVRNYSRFEHLLHLAQDLGVDNVSINPVHAVAGVQISDSVHFSPERDEARGLAEELARLKERYPILDSSDAYLKALGCFLRGEPLPVRCYAPYFAVYVDCYKDLIPCGGHFYDSKPFMNLGERRLREAWTSPEYEALRARLRRCRCCYYSCMAELNLAYARFP